ncbi:MAG: class I tRNA ligase family protein, partial [Clostridiales bacterium]|nr:class I tRNA ligase family protein [Clostridiales bacterium]
AVKGCKRFLDRVWNLSEQVTDDPAYSSKNESAIHKAIKKVSDDIDNMKFNTAIAALMALVNDFYANGCSRGDYGALLQMLNPFAPHMTEELWENMGYAAAHSGEMVCQQSWPAYDESKTVADTITIAVQVGGKLRGTADVPAGSDQETIVAAAKAQPKVAKFLAGMNIIKTIYVPGKLVNFIVKPQ